MPIEIKHYFSEQEKNTIDTIKRQLTERQNHLISASKTQDEAYKLLRSDGAIKGMQDALTKIYANSTRVFATISKESTK